MNYITKSLRMGPPHHIYLEVTEGTIRIQTFLDAAQASSTSIAGDSVHSALAGRLLERVGDYSLSLEELWTRNDWKDSCVWAVAYVKPFTPGYPINLLADSFPSRREQDSGAAFIGAQALIKFVVPFAEASFTDMDFFVLNPVGDSVFVSNAQFTAVSFSEYHTKLDNALPKLEISGSATMAPDSITEFSLSATWHDELLDQPIDVEIISVNGYVPRSRVRLTGSGTFRLHSLGMLAGETIKVKAGYRFFTPSCEKIIEVTNG